MTTLLAGRYLRQRWSRAVLIVASIALGVSTLVSARILNACLGSAVQRTNTPLAGSADLYITNGDFGVARTIAEELRSANLPGIASVRPLIYERVTLPELGHRVAVLIASDVSFDTTTGANSFGATFTPTVERSLAFLRAAATRPLVVLSKPVFDDWASRITDPMASFLVKSGTRQLNALVIGYFEFEPDSPLRDLGRNIVGTTLGSAEIVNRIDVVMTPGAERATVRQLVESVVGDRATVRTPEVQGEATREIVGGIQIAFSLCSAGAMVVGLFLVYNALSVTVAERRTDIGILRSVGATRLQIIQLFSLMAVSLGVLGSLAGIPLGIALAQGVLRSFQTELGSIFLTDEVDGSRPSAGTVIWAMMAGMATAWIASLIPAIQAANEDPADAVRRSQTRIGSTWRLAHYVICILLISSGIVMVLLRHSVDGVTVPIMGGTVTRRSASFGGMMAVLIGLLLASPLIVGVFVRTTLPIWRVLLPIDLRIAAENLTRAPGRTGVVVGALGAGVAVMVQTAGAGMSNQVPVDRWLDEVIQADRFVTAGTLTEATSSHVAMESDYGRELMQLPGVAGVAGIRYIRPEYNGTIVLMVALDALAYADLTEPRVPGGLSVLASLRDLPGADRILVSENFALRHGVQPGDRVTLASSRGPVSLTVAALVKDYSWPRGTLFIDRADYFRLFGDQDVDVFHVYLKDDAIGAEAVARYSAERGLVVLDRATMRQLLGDILDRVNTLVFLQQIVIGIVAALGVVTALLISVLQRRRELGLLLAVGATPRQVMRSVLAEAVLMGIYGTLLGVLIGLILEWYLLKIVLPEESGFVFDLLIPWRQTAWIVGGALISATAAGWIPARIAVKTRIPEAIAYE